MGRANLHIFDEWCGSSVDSLRKNVHFPLHPHVRTTVPKLALAPQQNQYGLRIFGYLHPPADGEYIFALDSAKNSELWLSSDESPLNVVLRAWVGKVCLLSSTQFPAFIHAGQRLTTLVLPDWC
uniref:PA14 domain-containing protein n=1 Tax=Knipowitschia caucasica TaxID=637954 RepID=A0AAV2KQI1_KNICA